MSCTRITNQDERKAERDLWGEKISSKVFVENKQPQKNITGRFLSGGAEKEKENKKEMWVEDKKEIEGDEGRKRSPFMHDWCLR